MSEYWLISAPGDKTCQQTWETMNNITNKQNNLSVNYKFAIPDLKVGTLDQLVGLSDDLGKLDTFVDQVTRKVATYLGEVLEDQRDKLHENLMANNNFSVDESDEGVEDLNVPTTIRRCSCSTDEAPCPLRSQYNSHSECSAASVASSPISCCSGGHESPSEHATHRSRSRSSHEPHTSGGDSDDIESNEILPTSENYCPIMAPGDLPSYITRFQWDMAKYPIKQSLRNIADIISKQVGQIDADLKTKSTAYNNLKGNLQSLEKKQTGSLLTRNLADLVKKEHFILDSEYLTTLLVIVPKQLFHDWETTYEKITDMIVPRSSSIIFQDHDYGLFTVSLFKKVVDEFKMHARERKFIVRDFTYNEEELAAGKNEITKLVTDKKKQFGPLVRWLKVNFSECFCAWVHVKALRVFVESVLRYGLPVNFQAILIHPNKKSQKKLRDILSQLYGHLDSSALQGSGHHDSVDIPGLGFGQAEYYPYVYYKLNIDMVD